MATAKKPAARKPAAEVKSARNAPKRGKNGAPKSVEAAPRGPAPGLSELEAAFVEQYLIDLNGTQAYLRVKPHCKEVTARTEASRILAKPNVQEAVAKAKAERARRLNMTADDVVRTSMAIVQADVRELVELRVGCCRYCWGAGHRWQRTVGEMERDRKAHDLEAKLARIKKEPVQPFDEQGGVGYDRRQAPNPECPECFGEGESRVVLKDTSRLSPAALRLLAGIKQGKDGIEIKTHSVDASMKDLYRHFGLYKERVELTGKDGGPVEIRELSDAERAVRLAALIAKAKSRAKK